MTATATAANGWVTRCGEILSLGGLDGVEALLETKAKKTFLEAYTSYYGEMFFRTGAAWTGEEEERGICGPGTKRGVTMH